MTVLGNLATKIYGKQSHVYTQERFAVHSCCFEKFLSFHFKSKAKRFFKIKMSVSPFEKTVQRYNKKMEYANIFAKIAEFLLKSGI